MRRIPGPIISGTSRGLAAGAPSGLNQYQSRTIYWANPMTWRADKYTHVSLDVGYSSQTNIVVNILGAQNGDRLFCSFMMSGTSLADTIEFPGVNLGAATLQDRVDADWGNDPQWATAWPEDRKWWTTFLFFLKTRGQLYLVRTAWKHAEGDGP
jgi:hypothetical protein